MAGLASAAGAAPKKRPAPAPKPAADVADDSPLALPKLEKRYGKGWRIAKGLRGATGTMDILVWDSAADFRYMATRREGKIASLSIDPKVAGPFPGFGPLSVGSKGMDAMLARFADGQTWSYSGQLALPLGHLYVYTRSDAQLYALAGDDRLLIHTAADFRRAYPDFKPEAPAPKPAPDAPKPAPQPAAPGSPPAAPAK